MHCVVCSLTCITVPLFYRKTKVTEKVSEDVAVIEDYGNFSLANTISNIEGKLNDGIVPEDLEDDIMPSVGEEMGSGQIFINHHQTS